ncbi:MAG: hypothetical protein WA131_12420 [Desulfitobacteriaceae bacterium]
MTTLENKLNKAQVIGLKITNVPEIYLGVVPLESDGALDLSKVTDSIIDSLNYQYLKESKFLAQNVANAESGTRIASWLNYNYPRYDNTGTIKIGNMNGDYSLYKEADSDPTYDDFAIRSKYEQTAYNGATNYDMNVRHQIPYTSDQLQSWGPPSSDNSTFNVSLPWGISWSWSVADSISITTTGNQTSDWANWMVFPRWYQLKLVSPARVEPGSAWLSTGTYAAMDITAISHVKYQGNIYSWYPNFYLRYDY